jgi:type II secretory pathway component PulF
MHSSTVATPIRVGLAAGLSVLFLLFMVFLTHLQFPKWVKMFNDFDAELPAVTRLVLDYGPIALPILAAALGVILIGNESLIRSRPLRWIIRVLFVLGAVAVLAAAMTVVLPMVQLMSNLD